MPHRRREPGPPLGVRFPGRFPNRPGQAQLDAAIRQTALQSVQQARACRRAGIERALRLIVSSIVRRSFSAAPRSPAAAIRSTAAAINASTGTRNDNARVPAARYVLRHGSAHTVVLMRSIEIHGRIVHRVRAPHFTRPYRIETNTTTRITTTRTLISHPI